MVLWWIGNVVLLLVVVPVLLGLLNRVLAALERIRGASDNILGHGVGLIGNVDQAPELLGPDRRDHQRGASRRGSLRRLRRQAAAVRGNDMPIAAWVTIVLIGLIIAAAALGLVRVIGHLDRSAPHARRAARRGAGHRRQDPPRAGGARVGEREPQARPRLLRVDLTCTCSRKTPPAGRPGTRSASSS